MMEEWKDCEDGYMVSSYGRFYSKLAGRCLSIKSLNQDGYVKVAPHGHTQLLNRLVAQAFIPNPHNKSTVNHIDGNKTNNRVDNLEWSTRSEQMIHAYKHELKKPMRGSKNANSKLTNEQVKAISKEYVRRSRTHGTVALGRKYGVSNRVIGLVVRGLAYRD